MALLVVYTGLTKPCTERKDSVTVRSARLNRWYPNGGNMSKEDKIKIAITSGIAALILLIMVLMKQMYIYIIIRLRDRRLILIQKSIGYTL